MDFPAFLVLATFLTGLVWGVDALLFAPKRKRKAAELERIASDQDYEAVKAARKEPYLVELCRSFFPIILIVLVVRSFLVEPFRIPSGSMMPTLLVGDFILVNKFNYGIRLPVLNYKIIANDQPQRGDIVVFRYPENPKIDYIKRVVGVPGDHVAYYNKILYINGNKAEQQPVGVYQGTGGGSVMTGASESIEDLTGINHHILVMSGRPDMNFEFIVPENEYFVMGDNRDNSRDSRFWGTVPDRNLVGKAFFIWMNWDSSAASIVDWSRIGSTIH
jgi:signal peptidase I